MYVVHNRRMDILRVAHIIGNIVTSIDGLLRIVITRSRAWIRRGFIRAYSLSIKVIVRIERIGEFAAAEHGGVIGCIDL